MGIACVNQIGADVEAEKISNGSLLSLAAVSFILGKRSKNTNQNR